MTLPLRLPLPLLAPLLLAACASRAPSPVPAPPAVTARPAAPAVDAAATYLALIRKLQEEGQAYAVLAHLGGYEARWGATPETRLLRADALRATRQEAAAAALYEQLLAGPQAAGAHHGLGLLAAARGDLAAAAARFATASQLQPTHPEILSDLGYARLRNGDVPGARVPLMTAAQLAPTHPRVLANLASYFLAAGLPRQAEAVLQSPHLSAEARALLQPRAEPAAGAPDAPRLRLEARLPERPAASPASSEESRR